MFVIRLIGRVVCVQEKSVMEADSVLKCCAEAKQSFVVRPKPFEDGARFRWKTSSSPIKQFPAEVLDLI